MSWPAPSDYQAAVQNPGSNFLDPDLRACQVAKTKLGLPRVASGTFASVYELHRAQARFAVRCFTREVTNQEQRYNLISQHLAGFVSPYLVDFQYLEKGIRVQGQWFPIVKMGWVEGQALQTYVEQHLDAPAILQGLAKQLRALVGQLRGLNMAHGDLQHGNILVTPQAQLKLVDYDGMFVPAMQGQTAPELGHLNFQHPRRVASDFDEQLDNFSALVIFLSLGALASNKGLWSKYHNGDNLILRRPDFEAPGRSEAFKELLSSREPTVRKLAEVLRDASTKPPGVVASLESCLSPIPTATAVPKPLGGGAAKTAPSPAHTPPLARPKPARQPSLAPIIPASKWRVWRVAFVVALLAGALGFAYRNLYLPPGRGQQGPVAERERQNRAVQQAQQKEQQRNALQQQYEAAQTNLQTLQQQLKSTAAGASISQEKLAATEAALRKEQELTAATQQRLAQAETNRQALETEKQQLAQQLHAIRREKEQILQHADKLAEGVTNLARRSELVDHLPALAMVKIEPGTFLMGSPGSEAGRSNDEGPQTRVTISKGFWMGKYEVTQGQYETVMGNNPTTFEGGANLPVESVSWLDASNFCAKLTERERQAGRLPTGYVYRLPTEAEWEYACRAGTTTATAYGDSLSPSQANFDGKNPYGGAATGASLGRTTKVGSYAPNAWGLYDMHGNVWEWCLDWYSGSLPGGSVTDPKGATTGSDRVFRGGGWNGIGARCRSAFRINLWPGSRLSGIGFRTVLVPDQ